MADTMFNKPQSYADTYGRKSVTIGVSGIIGAGKTTLSRQLGVEFSAEVFYEPVETNEYLEKFYKDMTRYSFPMQIYLLNHRFQQHQQIVWKNQNAIQDRTIYEDVIFAKMLRENGSMEELDFQTYRHLYDNMSNFLHRPDLIVYLDVEPDEALRRVVSRSRDCETTITVEYLTDLRNGYEDWLDDICPRIPVLSIDWNQFQSTKLVADLVRTKLKETRIGIVV